VRKISIGLVLKKIYDGRGRRNIDMRKVALPVPSKVPPPFPLDFLVRLANEEKNPNGAQGVFVLLYLLEKI